MKFYQTLHIWISKYATKYIYPCSIAFALTFPTLVWIALDKGLWRGDPVGYALNSLGLHKELTSNILCWRGMFFHGYKGPLIGWIGEFFVPLVQCTGSLTFSLLLIPVIATFFSMVLVFRSIEILFESKWIALCGSLIIIASPLMNGITTQFWIEPMQVALTSWFIYAMLRAGSWSFYFSIAQFVIAFSLAVLTKVSSPLYIVAPSVFFWITIWRNSPSIQWTRRDGWWMLIAILIFLPTAVFFTHNFKAILAYAHFASTSPLYGSSISQFDLMIQNFENGIFGSITFSFAILLLFSAVIKGIYLKTDKPFSFVFWVAILQIAIFCMAWLQSSNDDPRLFLPVLPYFTLLLCWCLDTIHKKWLVGISVFLLLVQFIVLTGFEYGYVDFNPPYGMIRPMQRKTNRQLQILQSIIPLASRDSAIIFDLNPELGVAEFQLEMAKQNTSENWQKSSIDIGSFFNYHNQEIDTGKIDLEDVWKNLLTYKPDYYITWRTRLSDKAAKIEQQKIDKYNAITIKARWAIAQKMNNCKEYQIIKFPLYPELLIYKRYEIF